MSEQQQMDFNDLKYLKLVYFRVKTLNTHGLCVVRTSTEDK